MPTLLLESSHLIPAPDPSLLLSQKLACLATWALVTEALLTPKPGLVDLRGPGSHFDLSLEKMLRSAFALQPYFAEIASVSALECPKARVRRRLGEIGREAEAAMFEATEGSNAHRGAIWAIGLLVASASMRWMSSSRSAKDIALTSGEIARIPDSYVASFPSHGAVVYEKYAVKGARNEAQSSFPHIIDVGLPMLRSCRRLGISDEYAHLNTLMAIMSCLDDTCLLFRGGLMALRTAQRGARQVLQSGGTETPEGRIVLLSLDQTLQEQKISPGGSADLLAGTIFLDAVDRLVYRAQPNRMRV